MKPKTSAMAAVLLRKSPRSRSNRGAVIAGIGLLSAALLGLWLPTCRSPLRMRLS